MAGWGGFFGKVADQFQGRIERLKNEKTKLLAERAKLINSSATAASTERVLAIDKRLSEIQAILGNKASD